MGNTHLAIEQVFLSCSVSRGQTSEDGCRSELHSATHTRIHTHAPPQKKSWVMDSVSKEIVHHQFMVYIINLSHMLHVWNIYQHVP